MKKLLLMPMLVIGLFGASAPSFALPSVPNFGPVIEMKMGGHMMHLQMLQDADGGQWVVMSRAEFEKMSGESLGKYKFTMMP
ncbi:MAG: hypothetical protein ABSF49_08985 [Roseiarcus sp.]|jgi:hypothetical protein|uniref:hypothetical protein n=1 Tax=Roseiarcus sp. TaxID=1969460 RepID=UPI003C160F8D